MKKLINDPKDVVRESLEGLALAHADILTVSFDPIYVIRRDAPVRGRSPGHRERCGVLQCQSQMEQKRRERLQSTSF